MTMGSWGRRKEEGCDANWGSQGLDASVVLEVGE